MLALLDNRITKTRYGQIFFDSLPDYAFTTKREDVERFFDTCLKLPWNRPSPPAHALRNYKGSCENVHGHNFKVQRDDRRRATGRHRDAGGFHRREEPDAAKSSSGWITSS